MAWTKRQLIEKAYEDIGYSSEDTAPDLLQSAVVRMDAMVAEWGLSQILINYPLSSGPDSSDIDTECDIPIQAAQTIWTNLAVRLASRHGKVISPDVKAMAHFGRLALVGENLPPKAQRSGRLPLGAGHKGILTGAEYFNGPTPTLDADANTL